MGKEYPIGVIFILNLDHRYDRLWRCYGALEASGAPVDKIIRFRARSGTDFEDLEALDRAARRDGWKDFLYHEENPDTFTLKIYAQRWNYCQMLRYLIEKEQSGVILYDDRYITDWLNLAITYQQLRRHAPDTAPVILQMDYYFSVSAEQAPRVRHPDIPYLFEGPLCGSDNAMLYSPAGAEYMLEKILEQDINVEVTINRLSSLTREERCGFWSYYSSNIIASYNAESDINSTDKKRLELPTLRR